MDESPLRLRERPFSTSPLAAAFFPAHSHEQARQQIVRCVERAEGVAVVVGAAGMGKSLLLAAIAERFHGQFHIAHLAGTAFCTRKDLLQNVLFELGLPYRGMDEGELRLTLIDHLQPSRECPHGMLLLVDEAHSLPLRLLEEIRLLTNIVREGLPRVRLVLAGSTALEERFANPKLASFNQRIAVRSYLHPFSREETAQYVRREIGRCGGHPENVVAADALRAVQIATTGIPRLINQLCDHALTIAYNKQIREINAALIQEAWADLQQLPTPWLEPTSGSTSSIEFGGLDEDAGMAASSDLGMEAQSTKLEAPTAPAEPLVPSAAALFGDDFHEEEIVIDRYAALAIESVANRPCVKTPEGQAFAREVAVLLPDVIRPTLKIAELPRESEGADVITLKAQRPLAAHLAAAGRWSAAENESLRETTIEIPFNPALDPVYPEYEPAAVEGAVQKVAIDEAHGSVPAPNLRSVIGPNRFKNLFASLRGKKS